MTTQVRHRSPHASPPAAPSRWPVLIGCAVIAIVPLIGVRAGWATPAAALSEEELIEQLRTAPPAPHPPRRIPPIELSEDEARQVVTYDPRTGDLAVGLPARGMLPAGHGALAVPLVGTPTVPVPIYDTLDLPWSVVTKLLVTFAADDRDFHYGCSGVLISGFHLLTAAHCVFNWDPNGDGDQRDAAWATHLWAFAGQTDLLAPEHVPERPFGDAQSALFRAYAGWHTAHDMRWDLALVTLDRYTGTHAGWMNLDFDHPVTSLDFSGYPTETPYVPKFTVVQYAGFGSDNVLAYDTHTLELAALAYGGHSGGPVFAADESGAAGLAQGVISSSDREGFVAAVLITADRATDLYEWMVADLLERPPPFRPDLCEYLLEPSVKALGADAARPGDTVPVTFNVMNSGDASSGTVQVTFMLSADATINFKDRVLDRRTLDPIAAGGAYVATTDVLIPEAVVPGEYYLGWVMQAAEAECAETNNAVVIGDHRLRIDPGPTATATSLPTHTPSATPTVTATATATLAVRCAGDCNGDGVVVIAEIVRQVGAAMDPARLVQCPAGDANHDGEVSIAELIAAVGSVLHGCPVP